MLLMHASSWMMAHLKAMVGDMPDVGSSGLVELRPGPRAVVNAVTRALDGPANTHCNEAFSSVSLMLSSLLLLIASNTCNIKHGCCSWCTRVLWRVEGLRTSDLQPEQMALLCYLWTTHDL